MGWSYIVRFQTLNFKMNMVTVIADTHTLKHLLREFKPVRLNTETHSALRLTQKADVTLIKVHVSDN